MILEEHRLCHDRMKRYVTGPMLILGNQENHIKYSWGVDCRSLDPDGGDLSWDLNTPVPDEWREAFSTVYNLGTIEHVWNAHEAFSNAARMVRVGGHYLHHGPCAGYEDHGIHVTDWHMIRTFFAINGFSVVDYWFTRQDGSACGAPTRGGGNIIFWMAAQRNKGFWDMLEPQQAFVNGVKA